MLRPCVFNRLQCSCLSVHGKGDVPVYIYLLGIFNQVSQFVADSSDELVMLSLIADLIEHLRAYNGSNPCALIFKNPLPEDVIRALNICFPELVLISCDDADEQLRNLRKDVLSLNKDFSVNMKNLHYVECRKRKLLFHFPDYHRTVNHPIGILPFERMERHGIVRCHESFAVNINHVTGLAPGAFVTENGCVIPISRSYSQKMTKYRKMFRGNTSRLND